MSVLYTLQVMKVIWPDVLKRFTVTEVIDRARSRLGENNYSPFKNNCEHFVTWCICGLKVSLQVKGWYQTALEFVKSVGAGLLISGRNKFVQVILVKIVTNISDEAIQSPIGTFVQKFPVVYGVGVALEVCWAIYGLIKARKSCKTEEELKVSRVEIFAKASGRLFFGIAGSVLFGAATFPGLVGGTIGAALGHILGFGTGQLYENRNYIDG